MNTAAGSEPTLGQKALWYIQSLEPDCAAYNVTCALRLHFAVDAEVLESAVRATVQGHRVLDAVYRGDALGEIRRRPAPARDRAYLEVLETGLDEDDPELRRHAVALTRRPFRLDRERPIRIELLRTRSGPDILLSTAHHIAADIVSQLLLCREILGRYAEIAAGRAPAPGDDGTAFDRFAERQRDYLGSPKADRARAHWQRELEGVTRRAELPASLPRPALYRFEGAEIDVDVPARLLEQIDEAAAARGVTFFAYLATAYQLVLHGFSGQRDFVVGYPVTQRRAELESEAIGYFVNTLPLRARIEPGDTFDTVLHRTSARLWRGLLCRDHPFALLQWPAELARDPARCGPVSTLFVLNELDEQDPVSAVLEPGRRAETAGLAFSEYPLPQQQGQFELTLQVTRRAAYAQAKVKYNTSMSTEADARKLADAYLGLLREQSTAPAPGK